MVIWTGHGWIGFVFITGCLIGGNQLIDYFLGDTYFEGHVWPKFAALFVCALLCWLAGRPLNRNLPRQVFDLPRRVKDPKTGIPQTVGATGHTLAFVRLEYAGLVAAPPYLFIVLEQAGFV
jgi:hypothetical protein